MIDWFPPTTCTAPAEDLGRWQGVATMRRVARAVDARDRSTEGHSDRVAEMAALIARQIGWTGPAVSLLREAGGIHDVGKVCLPESILLTPGPLTHEEYEVVKTHAVIGAQMATAVLSPCQAGWIRHHHERWDGRGYPDRLSAEEIPEGAAILSLADAWDAMTSRSWRRAPMTRDEALDECMRESGRQFAPWAVLALLRALAVAPREAARRATPLRLISAA